MKGKGKMELKIIKDRLKDNIKLTLLYCDWLRKNESFVEAALIEMACNRMDPEEAQGLIALIAGFEIGSHLKKNENADTEGEPQEKDVKDCIVKQLKYLSEASEKYKDNPEKLGGLTFAMSNLLESGQSNIAWHFPGKAVDEGVNDNGKMSENDRGCKHTP